MLFNGGNQNREKSYLFIDGASFQASLQELFDIYLNGQKSEINWSELRGEHRKVFYYDAIPVRNFNEDINEYAKRISPKQSELSFIERQNFYHVKTGDLQHRRTRGNEQKMVDVQLAVDALLSASRGLFDHFSLYTGDLDFRPVLSSLVEMGITVTLHYPLGHTNPHLISAADIAVPISIDRARRFLFLTDEQNHNLPSAYYDTQAVEKAPRNSISVWEDEIFGQCFLKKEENEFVLVTKRCRLNPKTHRLIAKAKSINQLRHYLLWSHEFSLPNDIN